ncbi:MAG: dTMP kinase [Acidimicrobiales bacterium]|jgi:dTMP kinase
MTGLFVAFEGIDGSGKSTQARRVASERDALFVFEPGDTPMGVDLRHWILEAVNTPMSPTTEALLLLADRSHHVHSVIEPALKSGRHVIADRFYASTLAYQGYGRGVDLGQLRAATQLAIGDRRPDLTILIDLSPGVANERSARSASDRIESANLEFHDRVREGYLELSRSEAGWIVVDGARPRSEVDADIDERLAQLPW